MTSAKAVTVVDLGSGNLRSVVRAFEAHGAKTSVTGDPETIRSADRIVLPGQGAFGDCTRALDTGVGEAVLESIRRGVPYLGICVGMQLLFERSEEAPGALGLSLVPGTVRRFSAELRDSGDGERLKIPHTGWNEVEGQHAFLPERGWFYFLHSYYCDPTDSSWTVGTTRYGHSFCAAIARDNVFACQFHPEKSHDQGHAFLGKFLNDR